MGYPRQPQNVLERLQFLAESDKTSDIVRWTGLPQSTINNYVVDPQRYPSAELSIKLAETRGVNIHWLLTGIGEPFILEEEQKLKSVTNLSPSSYDGDGGGLSNEGPPQVSDEGSRSEQLVIQIPAFEVRMTLPRGAEVPQNINVAIPLIRATKTDETKKG